MKSAGKARNNGLYRHIRTSKEIIRNLLNDYWKHSTLYCGLRPFLLDLYGKNATIILYLFCLLGKDTFFVKGQCAPKA